MLAIPYFSEIGPDTGLAWILWLGLGILFLVVLVGWAVSRNKGD